MWNASSGRPPAGAPGTGEVAWAPPGTDGAEKADGADGADESDGVDGADEGPVPAGLSVVMAAVTPVRMSGPD
ncbi:hypothetical protein SCA03_62250 [Streptomyces cacaoi]|uniref:Uncharacterized protein n=1 Tax=Streptomyces cacaoi TaxID=1898 RepID=A0A4Y3R7X3_STRCI|nr:hypothetical protein SCA03_62250 [Streptomyces cacaoi]